MTTVRIYIQPRDRRFAAFEVDRGLSNSRSVQRALGSFNGAFEVAYYPVPAPARTAPVPRAGRPALAGGAR